MQPQREDEPLWTVKDAVRLAPALLVLGVVLAGLWAGGGSASNAAGAAIAAVIALAAAVAVLAAPRSALRAALADHAAPIVAGMLFVVWGVFTALPAIEPLRHPLYAAFGVEGGAISIAPYRTLEGLALFLAPAAAFLAGAAAVARRGDRQRLGALLVGVGVLFCLAAFLRHFGALEGGGARLDAGLGSANAAATLFALFALVALAALARAGRGRGRRGLTGALAVVGRAPFALFLVVLCAAGLFLTASRGGALAFVGALVLMAALLWAGSSRGAMGVRGAGPVQAAAVVGALVLAVASFGAEMTLERLSAADGELDQGRASLFATHWQAFLDRPILGHGLNTFHELNAYYATPEHWRGIANAGSAHNVVLQALEEAGVIGTLLLAVMVIAPAARAGWAALRPGGSQAWSVLAVGTVALGLLHGLVDFGLNIPAVAALFAFILGAFSRR